MADFKLNKTQYSKESYERVINTSFTQNVPPIKLENTISVSQFFELYSKIFYDIPTDGEIDSHAYLVKTSGEYIGVNVSMNGSSNEIQILLDEITSLQQENLKLNQKIIELQISGSQTTI